MLPADDHGRLGWCESRIVGTSVHGPMGRPHANRSAVRVANPISLASQTHGGVAAAEAGSGGGPIDSAGG